MDRCPTCGLMLESTTVEGHGVQGCRECGGVLVAANDLTALCRETPAALGELERRFNSTLLAAGARTGHAPECSRCGKTMAERSFPKAPDVPMCACAHCKLIWLRDGQAEALQMAVAPDSARPRWMQEAEAQHNAAVDAEDDDLDEEAGLHEAHGHGPFGLWPERLELQPWASWIVCGMPLWLAPLLLFFAGLDDFARLRSSEITAQYASAGLLLPFVFWPIRCLFMTMALHVTWIFTDDNPGNTGLETFALLLRVVPVVMVGEAIGGLLTLATGNPLLGWAVKFVIGLTIYRRVMELDWRDIFLLAIVSRILAGYLAAGALLQMLAIVNAG